MANNKGQGLPLSFIVIAAISALVLILVIAFTIGGLGGFFKQIVAPAPEELGTVQVACNSYCSQLAGAATSNQFNTSSFCTKTFAIDISKDGKIDTATEAGLHCWGPAIGATCAIQIGDITYDQTKCPLYSAGK